MLLHGDALECLRLIETNSIDSLVTDPPAGIGFMGKDWDHHKGGRKEWCAWMESVMAECLRVLKPGGHGLVWAIPRTSHWTATALEDAGFEIRDCITHLFGSGFPKSLDVSKAIDKAAGAEREVTGRYEFPDGGNRVLPRTASERVGQLHGHKHTPITAPATEAAKQWQGWGTALKPAAEFWWLVRKPISEKTVAQNVQKWGTGALNIDASRIGLKPGDQKGEGGPNSHLGGTEFFGAMKLAGNNRDGQGRFPANLLLSHSPHCTDEACDMWDCPIALLDKQSGNRPSGAMKVASRSLGYHGNGSGASWECGKSEGGASRFFYCAKISSSERNAGLEGFEDKDYSTSTGATRPNAPARLGANPDARVSAKNTHPTVKPKKLMGYLIRMITPPNGTVLDPFMGSGSTGVAAKETGFNFIGIEKEEEYFAIAEARVEGAVSSLILEEAVHG